MVGVSMAALYVPAVITPSASSPIDFRLDSSVVVTMPSTGSFRPNSEYCLRKRWPLVGPKPA